MQRVQTANQAFSLAFDPLSSKLDTEEGRRQNQSHRRATTGNDEIETKLAESNSGEPLIAEDIIPTYAAGYDMPRKVIDEEQETANLEPSIEGGSFENADQT